MRFANFKAMMAHKRVRLWELAPVLRRSDGYLSDRLNGRFEFAPHERTRLAEYFGCSEDWLFQRFQPPVARRETASLVPACELR
jgi:hypothetical protein